MKASLHETWWRDRDRAGDTPTPRWALHTCTRSTIIEEHQEQQRLLSWCRVHAAAGELNKFAKPEKIKEWDILWVCMEGESLVCLLYKRTVI